MRETGLAGLQKKIAELLAAGIEVPSELEEESLRLTLAQNPADFHSTYSLVSLMFRLGRPPLPKVGCGEEGEPPAAFTQELLISTKKFADVLDTVGVFATLWVAAVRFPDSSVIWALFARSLAERGYLDFSQDAINRIPAKVEPQAVEILADALDVIAEAKPQAAANFVKRLHACAGDSEGILSVQTNMERISGSLIAPTEVGSMLRARFPTSARAVRAAAGAYYSSGDLHSCVEALEQALHLNLPGTLHWIIRSFSGPASVAFASQHLTERLAQWLDAAECPAEDLVVPPWSSPETRAATLAMRRVALDVGLPAALFATQPKSGSVSIGAILQSGFKLPTLVYGLVNVAVIPAWAREFARGGCGYITHLMPTTSNVKNLSEAGIGKIMVNVRDPRQWVVSYMHHLRHYRNDMLPPPVQAQFDSLSEAEQCEFAISAALNGPYGIRWIQGWFAARKKIDIHWFTFERFRLHKEKYIEQLIGAYGGSPAAFDQVAALAQLPSTDYHFRSGQVDEWRTVLSAEQIRRINAAMPNEYWKFFGWSP
jgi:hypothetical protein